jgi:hypothetical protein
MADTEVLALARDHLRKEAGHEPGSIQRAIAGAAFDSAMAELNRRGAEHVLAQIAARRQHQDEDAAGG